MGDYSSGIYYTRLALIEDLEHPIGGNREKEIFIELEPNLEACVETQARREYNRLAGELFKGAEETDGAERLELLRLFLESADFKKLRAGSEKYLIEEKKVRFIVRSAGGRPDWEMKVGG